MRQMHFKRVFSRFKWEAIEVMDIEGAYVDGVWAEDAENAVTRTIEAIPLALSNEELRLVPDGEDSEGGITLTTQAELYFTDINATEQTTVQSYVFYQGYRWRVVGTNLMRGNVLGMNIYTALRHIQ